MRNPFLSNRMVVGLCLMVCAAKAGFTQEFRDYTADSTACYVQVAISPDNRLLAAVGWVPKPKHGLAILWDIPTAQVLARLSDFPTDCSRIAVSPDNKLVAVGCTDGSIHLFARKSDLWQRTRVIRHQPPTTYIGPEEFLFTANGQTLISTCRSRDSEQRLTCHGLAMTSLREPAVDSRHISMLPTFVAWMQLLDSQGHRVLLSYVPEDLGPLKFAVLDTRNGDIVKAISRPPTPKGVASDLTLKFVRDGSRVIAIDDMTVYEFSPETFTFKAIFTISNRINPEYGMSTSKDGTLLATCSIKGLIHLWEISSGDLLAS